MPGSSIAAPGSDGHTHRAHGVMALKAMDVPKSGRPGQRADYDRSIGVQAPSSPSHHLLFTSGQLKLHGRGLNPRLLLMSPHRTLRQKLKSAAQYLRLV